MAKKGKPENLVSFKKGQSGNPNGRPRKIPELNKLLSEISESDYQSIINKLVSKAKSGDTRAAEVLLDRAYGKANQNLKIDGDGLNINLTRKIVTK